MGDEESEKPPAASRQPLGSGERKAENEKPLRLAVLVSGGGTTLQALIDAIDAGRLKAEIIAVVSSRRDAYALERARGWGVPALVLRPRDFENARAHDRALSEVLTKMNPDLVVLAGYMAALGDEVLAAFSGRIMNIHPSLLPAFGGHGCYGRHVHQAVLERGCKISGATVHFVDATIDGGPIILQESVTVEDQDTPETLAARVGALEKELYVKAIALYAASRLRRVGQRVMILK